MRLRVLATVFILILFGNQTAKADDATLTGGAIVAEAQGIIQQLQNLGATWLGDGGIVINGTATQLSSLVTQLTTALGANVGVPINSLGYDIQALAKRVDSASKQLNQILTLQRNCGFENASALLSGIKNVGLLTTANIPLASTGDPRVDYFQFTGHNPEVIPREGGTLILYGYRLWVTDSPNVGLAGPDASAKEAILAVTRGPSDDAIQLNIPESDLDAQSGKVLALKVSVHQAKKFWFIRTGTTTTDLSLPFAVPVDYSLKFQVSGQIEYKCNADKNVSLAAINFDYHNTSCEDRKNVGPNTTTPQLPGGPSISNQQITGWHYVNWPDGHQSPNTRNQSNIQPATTATTVSASGWLDTASCVCVPIAGCHLDHDTFWQASVVPDVRYSEDTESIEKPDATATVDAVVPTTAAQLSFNTSCGEPGAKNMQYTIIPIINNIPQPALYNSPFIVGNEKGVTDSQTLGSTGIAVTWNPQPVSNKTQMQIQITRAACGY